MKKLLLAALALAAGTLSAAKSFEGTAVYQMSAGMSDKNVEMTFKMKDGVTRMEATMQGHTMINLMDPAAKKMTMLMPEKKMYMEHEMKAPTGKAKQEAEKPKLTKTGNSETIAGYKADEWLMETKKMTLHLWGTTELGSGFMQAGGKPGEGVEIPAEMRDKGFFPLRIVGDGKHGFSKMEATSVKPESLDASLFTVPADYKKMSLGGMMGADGGDAGAGGGMPPEAAAKMKAAMDKMTPEQKAMIEKMMKGKGAAAGGDGY
jgi:hypothetical protein